MFNFISTQHDCADFGFIKFADMACTSSTHCDTEPKN